MYWTLQYSDAFIALRIVDGFIIYAVDYTNDLYWRADS